MLREPLASQNGLVLYGFTDTFGVRVEPRAFPASDRHHNTRSCRLVAVFVPIAQTHTIPRCTLQFTSQVRSRTEDERFNERELPLLLKRLLLLEEGPEFFGFDICSNDWAVRSDQLAIRLPGPCAGIPEQTT
jgi:hypothetical protein